MAKLTQCVLLALTMNVVVVVLLASSVEIVNKQIGGKNLLTKYYRPTVCHIQPCGPGSYFPDVDCEKDFPEECGKCNEKWKICTYKNEDEIDQEEEDEIDQEEKDEIIQEDEIKQEDEIDQEEKDEIKQEDEIDQEEKDEIKQEDENKQEDEIDQVEEDEIKQEEEIYWPCDIMPCIQPPPPAPQIEIFDCLLYESCGPCSEFLGVCADKHIPNQVLTNDDYCENIICNKPLNPEDYDTCFDNHGCNECDEYLNVCTTKKNPGS